MAHARTAMTVLFSGQTPPKRDRNVTLSVLSSDQKPTLDTRGAMEPVPARSDSCRCAPLEDVRLARWVLAWVVRTDVVEISAD